MEKKSIVIYGGSFNPPLNSHFSIAQQVLNEYEEVDKVVFIPMNKNNSKKELIENYHRINMLKLVAQQNDSFIIREAEMYGEKAIDTIEALKKNEEQFKDKEIWFLIGSDNLKKLHTWKCAEELVSNYKILVMERENDNMEKIIKNNSLLLENNKNFGKLNPDMRSNYNSTYVRKLIKEGKSIRYLMPDEIYKYIEKNKLYL